MHGKDQLFVENNKNLLECAFLQNIIEELILFKQLSDDQIFTFYKKIFAVILIDKFCLFYLYGEDIEEFIMQIRKERSDAFGNELWYQLMLAHLKESPYGKQNHISDFEDMIVHFKHRKELEMRIVRENAGDLAVILPPSAPTALSVRIPPAPKLIQHFYIPHFRKSTTATLPSK